MFTLARPVRAEGARHDFTHSVFRAARPVFIRCRGGGRGRRFRGASLDEMKALTASGPNDPRSRP
jgi:hypothetical protein